MRERPVVLARRRRRWPVRSGRAFRAAEHSSRRASPRDRHRPPDIPSSRPRFPRPHGGQPLPAPERHPVLPVGNPFGEVRRLPVPVVKGRGGVREVEGHQALLVGVQHHRSPDLQYLRSERAYRPTTSDPDVLKGEVIVRVEEASGRTRERRLPVRNSCDAAARSDDDRHGLGVVEPPRARLLAMQASGSLSASRTRKRDGKWRVSQSGISMTR